MKPLCTAILFAVMGVVVSGQQPAQTVTMASRLLPDGSRSLLVYVQQISGPVDDVRIDLPGNASRTAVLMSGPSGWTLERDGNSARLSGAAVSVPIRLRISLFDVRENLQRSRVRVRQNGRDALDQQVVIAALDPLSAAGPPQGLLDFPTIVSPGETIEATVLNPARTPNDGQWVVAGVPAVAVAPNRLSIQLPKDLPAGSPLRITYFDVWGERIVEALSADDTVVVDSTSAATARITGCARYGFLGESICVCGNFPESARTGIRVDGQSATVLAASRHVLRLSLPATMMPGPHTVSGDPSLGFPASDSVTMIALRLQGSLDSSALLRGQSTTMRLGVEGATEPMKLTVTNKTPWVVSIPGGNHQEVDTSGGTPNAVEMRVDATGKGNFAIDYKLDGATCPCQDQTPVESISSASRPTPLVVPRRVLATIAAATPAATLAIAQAVALANGLAVVEVIPLPAAAIGLAVFEIVDGIGAIAKAAALAADPRVTLAQPDFIYDASQATTAPAQTSTYGLQLIGADVVQRVSRGDGIRVGVIDAGIDTGHAGLAKKVAEYADVTGTGWTPDAHGTLVAGVIASESTAGAGYSGVAPGVQIVAVKSCVALSARHAAARCWSSTLARGIELAIQKNVRVMNLSVGGPEDRLLARMIEAASKKGVAVVSAVGNDGPTGKPSYPAAFESVIAVTAVDAASRLYSQATRGAFVDVAAPGVDIMSTAPGNRTQIFSGTSAATAFASGAVALLLRQRPTLTQTDLTALLRQTARDLGTTGPDAEFGYGLLDVCRALARLSSSAVACR
ncbi:MAG TPA: S8 family serine peptidase [Vicinamibacterales bacterium]|jgi:hypothetical protein